CKLNPYVKNFTVNGLWATKRPYTEQVNCPAPKQFDPQYLATIRNQLAIQWENLKDYQCPMPLWEKQWDVYGSVRLASVGIRPDSSTYIGSTEFQAALQMLYRQEVSFRCKPYKAKKLTHMYVMNGTFGHKINGTNTLDRNKIRFTRQPRNRTVDQGNLNLLQFDEVIFCFSEYLQLIDCPMYTQKNNSCEDGFIFAEFPNTTEYVKQLGSQTFKDCNCTECPKLNTTMKRLV
ncbi:hypothetical protein EWB00_010123, partial [Schistosoma japonicum]